jgi:hypothetical protein
MGFVRESLVLVFLSSLTAAPVAQGLVSDDRDVFNIRVHLQIDPSSRSTFVAADLKEETAGLWRPYGVHIEWVDADAGGAAPRSFCLEAILEGKLRVRDEPKRTTILGRAIVNLDGPSAQPIRVSVDATDQVLVSRRAASPVAIVHTRELSRALGRVLAHEIGHVLLGPYRHDAAGLMRAAFLPDELAAPSRAAFRLSGSGLGQLRSRIHVLARMANDRID